MNCDRFEEFRLMSERRIFKSEYDGIPIVFRVNRDKVSFSDIEKLEAFQQLKKSIIVEKINNLELYIQSKCKEGFEDYSIKLSAKTTAKTISIEEL